MEKRSYLTATKKGTILDLFFIAIVLIVVMIAVILSFHTFNTILGALQSSENFNNGELNITSQSVQTIANFNYLMLFIWVGVGVASVVSAFAVRTHPIFFVFFLLLQVLLLAILPMFQDAYNAISSNPSFSSSVTYFNWFAVIISNLPIITLALSVLVALAMFALPSGGGYG